MNNLLQKFKQELRGKKEKDELDFLITQKDIEEAKKICATFFKDQDGKPIQLTTSQAKIFHLITKKPFWHNQVIAFTRFGKSFTTALAVLTRLITFPEKWAIVAPTDKQAKIIMGYIIEHLFDHEYILSCFQTEPGENLDKIRRARTKSRIVFRLPDGKYSEVFVLSAQEKQKQNPIDALLGFGAPNIVLDESSLIDDVKYAAILRMLGDSPNPFLIELGNPLRKNHFYRTFQNENVFKLIIDYKVGLKEGRITKEQVELMKLEPFFDVFYECKFPKESEIFKREWLHYVSEDFRFNPSDYQMFAIGTDLAISEKSSADYNAYVVVGLLKSVSPKMIVLSSMRMKGTMNEFLEMVWKVYNLYSRFAPTILGVENSATQKMFAEEFSRRYLVAPFLVNRVTDKLTRFYGVQPYFQTNIVFFNRGNNDLIEELLSYPSEHDDMIDALEMAISLLKDYVNFSDKIKSEEETQTKKSFYQQKIEQLGLEEGSEKVKIWI